MAKYSDAANLDRNLGQIKKLVPCISLTVVTSSSHCIPHSMYTLATTATLCTLSASSDTSRDFVRKTLGEYK